MLTGRSPGGGSFSRSEGDDRHEDAIERPRRRCLADDGHGMGRPCRRCGSAKRHHRARRDPNRGAGERAASIDRSEDRRTGRSNGHDRTRTAPLSALCAIVTTGTMRIGSRSRSTSPISTTIASTGTGFPGSSSEAIATLSSSPQKCGRLVSNPVLENHQPVERRHRRADERGRDRQHHRKPRKSDGDEGP